MMHACTHISQVMQVHDKSMHAFNVHTVDMIMIDIHAIIRWINYKDRFEADQGRGQGAVATTSPLGIAVHEVRFAHMH
jgi:hypothetical protein